MRDGDITLGKRLQGYLEQKGVSGNTSRFDKSEESNGKIGNHHSL